MITEKQKEASRRTGKLFGGLKPRTLEVVSADFWEQVEKTDGCWFYHGAFNRAGYGVMSINGKPVRAHRYSYEVAKGPIPKGLIIRHSCDNPSCVRPEHLSVGTDKDNSDDKMRKSRNGRPPLFPRIPIAQVEFILSNFKPHKYSAPKLAYELGLTLAQVKNVIYGGYNAKNRWSNT